MNRAEFLSLAWEKGIRPVLLLVLMFFCGKFLVAVLSESGEERTSTLWVLSISLVFAALYFLGILFNKGKKKIQERLPERTQSFLSAGKRVMDYLAPIITGILIYHFWQKDWKSVSFILLVLMVDKLLEVFRK